MVKGLDVFARFFADDASRYVLIGGVATHLVLGEAGLAARATKDLDIVLCVEALDAGFGARLWDFIRLGGCEARQAGTAGRCFYRFAKPRDSSFPAMLGFFAREPGFMPLAKGAHLTPVSFEQEVQSLSAILLDSDYYTFLHAHAVQLAGVHVVTEKVLIALKARAWLDLSAPKAADANAVDGRHITKHRNDVLRLAQFTQAVQGRSGHCRAARPPGYCRSARSTAGKVTGLLRCHHAMKMATPVSALRALSHRGAHGRRSLKPRASGKEAGRHLRQSQLMLPTVSPYGSKSSVSH
ncbi:hypothetical protein [Oryzisolibacter sp. LB2S]|uniref:hypothetical protein n=1 Tax=Alicycliphilus soli TaxID=3228789 RepID=UPI003459B019